MIYLTRLDDHAEPTPLGRYRTGRAVPTIAQACGFSAKDYVPDPMDAPLGRLRFLRPDAAKAAFAAAPPPAIWPASWRAAQGAAALAIVFLCDVLAPCDRLPGLTAPMPSHAEPLRRDHVADRLGNLRDGRPRLDVIHGGACLQGSTAVRDRMALRAEDGSGALRTDRLADLRLAAHPATLAVKTALVDLHNAMCRAPGVTDPRARATALWHDCIRRVVLPRLCGEAMADGSVYRAFAAPDRQPDRRDLPLEAVLGPFSLLIPMLLAPTDQGAAAAALTLQARRAARHNTPGPVELCDLFGLAPPPQDATGDLPSYLLAEAAVARAPLGQLGAALLSDTVLGLIDLEDLPVADPPDDSIAAAIRNLCSLID